MTIKQIAEKAGTSRGTVDRVLNGRGKQIRAGKRILDIAERERYQPNQLAQALIRSRQRTHIGMVIPSVGNPFERVAPRRTEPRQNSPATAPPLLSARSRVTTPPRSCRPCAGWWPRAWTRWRSCRWMCPRLRVPAVTAHTGGHSQHRYRCRPCGLCRLRLLQQRYDHRRSGAAHAQWPGPRSGCYRQHQCPRPYGSRARSATALESTPEITVDAVLENQDDDDVSYQVLQAYLAEYRRTWCALPPPVSTAVCGHPGKRKEYPRAGGGRDGGRAAVYGGRAHCRHCDPGALRPGGRGGACAVRLYPHRTAARRRRGVYHNRVRVRHSQ